MSILTEVLATYIQLKGLQDGPVAPWDGTEESQQLLNDAVEVVETADGIHA